MQRHVDLFVISSYDQLKYDMRNCIIIFYFVSSVKRTFDRILYFNILLLTVSALRLFVSVGHSSHGKPSGSRFACSFIHSFVRSLPVRNLFSRLCSWFLPYTPPSRIFLNYHIYRILFTERWRNDRNYFLRNICKAFIIYDRKFNNQ